MQRVSQKQIASYIGVTPEFFSKMKSKTVEAIKNEPFLTRFSVLKLALQFVFLDAVLVYNFLLDEPHERIRAVAVIRIMEFDELYVVDDFFLSVENYPQIV